MSISLLQWDGSTVTPKDDAILYDHFQGGESGILSGCEVTHLGTNQLQIAAGRGMICGRVFVITQETVNATVSDSGTKHGRLIVKIDTEGTPVVSFVTQMAATLPSLTQDDINDSGTVFQLPLCTYDISTTTISNLVDVSESLASVPAHTHGPSHVVGARFTRTTAQSIADATATAISWDGWPYDPDTSKSGTYASRMYVKYAGVYTISASATMGSLLDGSTFWAYIKKNGTKIAEKRFTLGGIALYWTADITIDCVELSVDDYLELFVEQTGNSGAKDVKGNLVPVYLSMRRNMF